MTGEAPPPVYPLAPRRPWWFESWDPADEPTLTKPLPPDAEAALAEAFATWDDIVAPPPPDPSRPWRHEAPGWGGRALGRADWAGQLPLRDDTVAVRKAIRGADDLVAGLDPLERADAICDLPIGGLSQGRAGEGWAEVETMLAPLIVDLLRAAAHPAGPRAVAERLYRCTYWARGDSQWEPELTDLLQRSMATPATPAAGHMAAWRRHLDPLRLWLKTQTGGKLPQGCWDRLEGAATRVAGAGADPDDWRVRWLAQRPEGRTVAGHLFGLFRSDWVER